MLIIIAGAGSVGFGIAQKLSQENMDVVVIDNDAEALERVDESLDVAVVEGNGSSPSVLRKAGIKHAEMLITVTRSDEVNMMACLVGTLHMPPGAVRIARIRNQDYLQERQIFDRRLIAVDLTINPERVTAEKILRLLTVPAATDVTEFANGKVQIVGLPVLPKSGLDGVMVRDIRTRYPEHKVLFAAISRTSGVIIPGGQDTVVANDHLLAVTEPSRLNDLLQVTGHQPHNLKQVIISGGSSIADHLAQGLERNGIHSKVITPDRGQCDRMAGCYSERTMILHGEGTDLGLLEQENIGDADAFVAAGPDDEDNILAALLAKRLGVRRTVVVTNKAPYIPIIKAVGVDAAISTHQVAVSQILQYVRKGKVLQVSSLGDEAEAIEFEALSSSPLVNKPLSEARLPKGAMVAAIVRHDDCTYRQGTGGGVSGHKNGHSHTGARGHVPGLLEHGEVPCSGTIIIPDGSAVVHPRDRVIIFAMRKAIPAIEKILTRRRTF